MDTAAPAAATTIALASASDTGAKGDGITADATPTLTGTSELFADIEIVAGGQPGGPVRLGEVRADAAGNWTFTVPQLPEGPVAFMARATDIACNSGGYGTPL